MPSASPPPLSFRHRNEEGYFEIPWQRFFLEAQAGIVASAPAGAFYVVLTADGSLPNAQSLGALRTGWIHSTVSGVSALLDAQPVTYQDLAPTVDITIPANMGAIVPDHFAIAGVLTLAAGAVFEIT